MFLFSETHYIQGRVLQRSVWNFRGTPLESTFPDAVQMLTFKQRLYCQIAPVQASACIVSLVTQTRFQTSALILTANTNIHDSQRRRKIIRLSCLLSSRCQDQAAQMSDAPKSQCDGWGHTQILEPFSPQMANISIQFHCCFHMSHSAMCRRGLKCVLCSETNTEVRNSLDNHEGWKG